MRRRMLTHLLTLGLSLSAASAGGETFWTTAYGKLVAFELNFDSGAARYVMQAIGDPTDSLAYQAVATEPGTGALLVFYYEAPQYRVALGRLHPGSFRPQLITLLPGNYDGVLLAKFSPGGVLYLLLNESWRYRLTLATLDYGSGAIAPILTFDSPSSLDGFGFDPISGLLFLSGQENCNPACTWFLDTLSIPQHYRERVLGSTNYVTGDPLFSAAGQMLVMDYNFYSRQAQTLGFYSNGLRFTTPIGLALMQVFHGSPAEGTEGCMPSISRGCLQNRRFAVEATYDATEFGGTTGVASAQLESDESLKFSFFSPANLEMFVKVVDGCSFNGHFWVFASGLTNLGVSLRVTDTVGGTIFVHNNRSGQTFTPALDIEAFPCGE